MMPSTRDPKNLDLLFDDPRSYLWNDESDASILAQNKDNYELLLNTYNGSSFASFTGAGVSKALGISDWTKLIVELQRVAKKEGFLENQPPEKERFPEFAENIYGYLESKGLQQLYFDTIKEFMTPSIGSTSVTLICLSLCMNVHLTTNFDKSIEHAYSSARIIREHFLSSGESLSPEICQLSGLTPATGGPAIIYLHGSVEEGIYILRKSDYEIYYPTISNRNYDSIRELEDCLRFFFRSKNVVFIGFSFEDPYVKDFFFSFMKEIDREAQITEGIYAIGGRPVLNRQNKHFLLTDDSNSLVKENRGQIFSNLKGYNLYPIVYQTGKHIFLEYLFKEIMRKGKGIS